MKPGDIVYFNVIKNDQAAFEVQGEFVALNFTATDSIVKTRHRVFNDDPVDKQRYFYSVSTASLKLIELCPKDFLESGRIVIFRGGSRGIVVSLKGVNFIMIKNELVPLQNFDENLRHQLLEEYDIIKVAEMKEGCSFEYFNIVRKEMLDIVWKGNFYTID